LRREEDEGGRIGPGGDEARAGVGDDAPAETPGAGPLAEPWLLGAGLCVMAAAVCLVLGFYDAAFVAGALGAVAWFLNLRARLPRPPDEADDDPPEDEGQGD
jgi:hypothetical protein